MGEYLNLKLGKAPRTTLLLEHWLSQTHCKPVSIWNFTIRELISLKPTRICTNRKMDAMKQHRQS